MEWGEVGWGGMGWDGMDQVRVGWGVSCRGGWVM